MYHVILVCSCLCDCTAECKSVSSKGFLFISGITLLSVYENEMELPIIEVMSGMGYFITLFNRGEGTFTHGTHQGIPFVVIGGVGYGLRAVEFMQISLDVQGTKRGRTKSMAGVATSDPPSKALKRSGSVGNDITGLIDGTMNDKRGAGYLGEPSGFGGGMSSSMGGGTPRESGSQLGNPWDQWDNDGGLGLAMNLGMDMGQSDADILAEFGDFGDFFEDDGLGFGEVSYFIKEVMW